MKTLSERFLDAVERYLRRTGTKPSEFGRLATAESA
jgi:hypothetical protein